MAAVQDGPIESEGDKETKTDALNDGAGNITGSSTGVLSSPPNAASSATGATKSMAPPGPENQQTLLAVLQYLKKNNLLESVDILRREAGLSEDNDDSQNADGSGGIGPAASVDEGGDANSLLNRVSIATAAPVGGAAAAPSKGGSRLAEIMPWKPFCAFLILKQHLLLILLKIIKDCSHSL